MYTPSLVLLEVLEKERRYVHVVGPGVGGKEGSGRVGGSNQGSEMICRGGEVVVMVRILLF